jgi:hypothetical protein
LKLYNLKGHRQILVSLIAPLDLPSITARRRQKPRDLAVPKKPSRTYSSFLFNAIQLRAHSRAPLQVIWTSLTGK